MALFTCPECGKKISDTAGFCPNCGYPVRNTETTTVRIRIPEELHGQYKGRKNYAEVSCNQKVVWSGILGTTAVFSLAQKAEVNVYIWMMELKMGMPAAG